VDVAAIIPTRAGSKGLPDKCMREVAGVTLIAHAVGQALRTCGSAFLITDNAEHAEEARAAGGIALVQEEAVPGDALPEHQETRAMLAHPELFENYGTVCRLFVTHPLRSDSDILRSLDLHQETGRTVVTSSTALFQKHQVMRAVSHRSHLLRMRDFDPARPRQQVAPPEQYLVGCCYVASRSEYLVRGFWPRAGFETLVVPPVRGLDVDTPEDLELIRTLWPIRDELAQL